MKNIQTFLLTILFAIPIVYVPYHIELFNFEHSPYGIAGIIIGAWVGIGVGRLINYLAERGL